MFFEVVNSPYLFINGELSAAFVIFRVTIPVAIGTHRNLHCNRKQPKDFSQSCAMFEMTIQGRIMQGNDNAWDE